MDLRVKADLTMLYDLRPETFGELIQQPKKDVISICNCFSDSYLLGTEDSLQRLCEKKLQQDFKLKCGACYVNEGIRLLIELY